MGILAARLDIAPHDGQLMKRAIALVGPAIVISGALAAAPAWAASTTEVVQGDVLRLVSVADWASASTMLPGQPMQWDVAVSADAAEPGTVTLSLSAQGDATLLVDASLCMQEWEAGGCPGGASVLRSAWSIPLDGSEVALADFAATDVGHLRLWITLSADDGMGVTDVRVHAHGVGESVVVGPEGALAATGGAVAPWVIGAGAVVAVVGVVLVTKRADRAAHAGRRDA